MSTYWASWVLCSINNKRKTHSNRKEREKKYIKININVGETKQEEEISIH